ncbi:uncharacterized protein LOC134180485 isoform X2 [Corticium candelabrum]|uniref:uncharacterized protein LOC134180485 isoform X2 n=1 Tax=Corticium candelabrum TaxID=121492 RepID=UPI002E264A59|nr:uncharacterized protein LOC134180485 isoform X2 [Corticium candelabrum]
MAYCRSAADIILKALSLEESSSLEACELYTTAIEILLQGARDDDDLKRKKAVKEKILQYMSRFEKLLKLGEEFEAARRLDIPAAADGQKPISRKETLKNFQEQRDGVGSTHEDSQENRETRTTEMTDKTHTLTSNTLDAELSVEDKLSDMGSWSSQVEDEGKRSFKKNEEELRHSFPDALAATDALASINRLASKLRQDPEMWELEEELKRILKESN